MLLLAAVYALPAGAHIPFDRGDATVTEIDVRPADEGGQWFEVRNDTTSSQNLVEQVFTDADGDTFQVALTVIVRAGEYAVFSSPDSPVEADYHFPAAFDLRAEAGAVVHTDLTGTIDEARWDAAWGVSGVWQLDAGVVANEWANDLPGSWCAAVDVPGEGWGTPGAENVRCPGSDTDDDGDGFAEVDGDCDDRDAEVFPGAHDGPAVPDDGDCDGARDDDAPVDTGDTGDTGADTGDTAPDTGDTGADTGDSGAPADTGDTADTAGGGGPEDTDDGGGREGPDARRACGGCDGGNAAAIALGGLLLVRRRSRRVP